jgi:hypothetical protein
MDRRSIRGRVRIDVGTFASAEQPRSVPGVRGPWASGRPGLLLDHEVALDREDTASLAEVEELDQVGVDVQLVALLAQPARDPEAESLAAVRHPEGRVEARDDEPPGAMGAAVEGARHVTGPLGG